MSFFMAGAVAVAALDGRSHPIASHRAEAAVSVLVEPRCPVGRDSQAVITPWNITVAQGDSVDWTVSEKGSATAITIVPKNVRTWPFTANRSNGNRQNPARASGMRANARGRYSYSVEYVCRANSPNPDTVRIDPDVIVE
jgi:hypothetical protein